VFVTSNQGWQMQGNKNGFTGGARPQTAEVYRTFGESCPVVIMTNRQEKADFIVLLEHEGGKGLVRRRNKVAVFTKEGDMLFPFQAVGNSVKDACEAISH
jgi:hypothetical protein